MNVTNSYMELNKNEMNKNDKQNEKTRPYGLISTTGCGMTPYSSNLTITMLLYYYSSHVTLITNKLRWLMGLPMCVNAQRALSPQRIHIID